MPWFQPFNVFAPDAGNRTFRRASSSGGTLDQLSTYTVPLFGDAGSAGPIGVARTPSDRTFFACRINIAGLDEVAIGSIGDDGSANPPTFTGIGIIAGANPSEPALAWFKNQLWLFFRDWYGDNGYGPTKCVPITITDNQGHFQLGSVVTVDSQNVWGAGRITATATSSQL